MTIRRNKKHRQNRPRYSTTKDVQLVRRSVRENWNPPQSTKDRVVNELGAVLETEQTDLKTLRRGLTVCNAFVEMTENKSAPAPDPHDK